MNLKNVSVGVLMALVLVLGMTFPRGNSVVRQIVGATPTLDGVDAPDVRIGGAGYVFKTVVMSATSSIPCSYQVTSTSSIQDLGINIKTNGMGTQVVDFSTSSTAFGSSTPAFIKAFTVTAATSYEIPWRGIVSTTTQSLVGYSGGDATGQSNNIVYPGQYLNFRIATVTPGSFTTYLVGNCSFSLKKAF